MTDKLALLRYNKRLFYWATALEYTFFNDAIFILFGREYLHLDYFRAGSLFFIGWFVSISLDFYGGVVADRIGRKRAALYGICLQIVSYGPYLFCKSYTVLALMSVVWGIGVALSSNSLHALIYEQVAQLKIKGKESYAHISATSQIWLFTGVGLATVIGGYAYKIDPRLPYGLMMITLFVAGLLTCFIRVPVELEEALISDDTPIVRTALKTFKKNNSLRNFVIVSFWAGLFGDLLFAYYQPYYIDLKVSAVTLGLLFGGLRVASAFGAFLMRRLSDTASPPAIQVLNIVGMLVTAGLMLVLKLPVVLAAPIILGITSGFVEPNMRLYINKHAVDSARASALSFGTMIMNFGVGLGFVVAFYLADQVSATVILGIISVGSSATLALRMFYSSQGEHKQLHG